MEDIIVKEKLLEIFYGNERKLSKQNKLIQCYIDELYMNINHIAFMANTTKERVLYNVIKLSKEGKINLEDLRCICKKNVDLFTKEIEPDGFK